jgi:UDP-N-acetylglucosamine--N-acetylmuramyl-(pentapeptide) pyrophosphoryl-undecaprenol N-acetylglucosamine transferase
VIFVTLGTHEQPFDRALDVVAALAGRHRLFVQHGATPPRPGLSGVEWSDYLDWEPLRARMRDADVVITHAGVGSAVTAIRAGKKPVLLPRLARYGEHVDDHQLQLAERLAEFGLAVVCTPEAPLEGLVAEACESTSGFSAGRRSPLARAVADAALSR